MILRKDGIDMIKREMETADAAPSKKIKPAEETETLELVYEPGLTITINGENFKSVDNICIYFKEDKDE